MGMNNQTGMLEPLSDSLCALAELRTNLAANQGAIDILRTALAETDLGKRLVQEEQRASMTRQSIMLVENTVKSTTVAIYERTKDKKPMQGVEIKEFTRLEYNPEEVVAWAKTNATAYFTFDFKSFEAAAKTMPGAPVRVVKEPRAQIAKDLGMYLKSETPD